MDSGSPIEWRDVARHLGAAIEAAPVREDGSKVVEVPGNIDPKVIAKLKAMGIGVKLVNRKKRRGACAKRRRRTAAVPPHVFVDAEQELRRKERNRRKADKRKRGR